MRRRAGVLWCVALGILQTSIVNTLAVVDPPFNLMTVNVTQNTLQYSWEVANTSCNGSSTDSYTRSLDEESPVATNTGVMTEDSITDLQPNTSYSVRVRVVCSDGNMSNFSTPLTFTTEKIDCSLECLNGGTLEDVECSCFCANSFQGMNCSECPRDLDCQNGGTENRETCSCSCTGGFSGDNCEDCSLSCMNGGTFNDSLCLCTCMNGYIGQSCETLDLSINLTTAEYVGIGIASGVILLLCCIGFIWAIVSDYCVLSTKFRRRNRSTDPW